VQLTAFDNPFVERVIGSIRRECLDHVIIINERHVLSSYFRYYHESRTHLSLDKDCPETRPILPPTAGKIVAVAQLGGLHHRYETSSHLKSSMAAPSCSLRCSCHHLVAQPPQPSGTSTQHPTGRFATGSIMSRTMHEKTPAVVFDERIRERYGIMSKDR
jgi:hypothetical protein